MSKYESYVAIDFGTSGITFAYSFESDVKNKDFIQVKKWEGQGTANKTKTEIILDESLNNIIAFGRNQCRKYQTIVQKVNTI